MNDLTAANLIASLAQSRVEVESLADVVGASTHAVDDLNHRIKATESKVRQDIESLDHLIAAFESHATDAKEKVETARQHLAISFERLEHRADEIFVHIHREFQDATQQLTNFETQVEHLHESLKTEWGHSVSAQNELETALVHNGDQLKAHYDQVAHDYQTDLSSHIAQTSNMIAHEGEVHRSTQAEISSLLEQALAQQQHSLAEAGQNLASHCSALMGSLEQGSRQSLNELGHSLESQIDGLREGAQRLISELGQAAESVKKVVSDIEGTSEAVKTGVELTNVGLRDVVAILVEVIHLLETLEKDIEDIVPSV